MNTFLRFSIGYSVATAVIWSFCAAIGVPVCSTKGYALLVLLISSVALGTVLINGVTIR